MGELLGFFYTRRRYSLSIYTHCFLKTVETNRINNEWTVDCSQIHLSLHQLCMKQLDRAERQVSKYTNITAPIGAADQSQQSCDNRRCKLIRSSPRYHVTVIVATSRSRDARSPCETSSETLIKIRTSVGHGTA